MKDLIYKVVEGSQSEQPLEVDTVSSPTLVYLRRNIERIERDDVETGGKVKLWRYEEATLEPHEYLEMLTEREAKNSADIDYIAMMMEVEI